MVTQHRFMVGGELLPQARVRYDAEGDVARVDRYVYTTSAGVTTGFPERRATRLPG